MRLRNTFHRLLTAVPSGFVLPVLTPLILVSEPVSASLNLFDTDYRLTGKGVDSEFVLSRDGENLTEANFNSGLALSLSHQLVDLSLDYTVRSQLRNVDQVGQGELSQRVQGLLRSEPLNNLFNLDAVFRANSLVEDQGDRYNHSLVSEFSRPLADSVNLTVGYNYGLNKRSASDLERETFGYVMDLAGSLDNGRLIWESGFVESRTARGELSDRDSLKEISLNTRYQIVSDVHIDLSSVIKSQSLAQQQAEFDEKRYAAGVSWSPARNYDISFKVNKSDDSRFEGKDIYGSGSISWVPQSSWRFELSYDDNLVDGLRGLMFSTRFSLDES